VFAWTVDHIPSLLEELRQQSDRASATDLGLQYPIVLYVPAAFIGQEQNIMAVPTDYARPPSGGTLQAQTCAILNQHDRIFYQRIMSASQERAQNVQYGLDTLAQKQHSQARDLQEKIHKLEEEKRNLHVACQNLKHECSRIQADQKQTERENQELFVDLSELGLRLAQAWKLRHGLPDQVRKQFEAKGLRDLTIQHIFNTGGFFEELEHALHPRRSERRSTQTSSYPSAQNT
jgi:hypothetical protein